MVLVLSDICKPDLALFSLSFSLPHLSSSVFDRGSWQSGFKVLWNAPRCSEQRCLDDEFSHASWCCQDDRHPEESWGTTGKSTSHLYQPCEAPVRLLSVLHMSSFIDHLLEQCDSVLNGNSTWVTSFTAPKDPPVWFTKCWCVILNDSHSLPGGDVPCRTGRDGDRTDPARQLDWQTGHAAHRGHYPRGERPWGRQQPSRTPGAVKGLQWEHHAQGPAQLQRYTATAAGEERGGCIWWFPQSCLNVIEIMKLQH